MDPAVKAYFQKITSKGGKARAAKLTPERRREIARKAIAARWSKDMDKLHAQNAKNTKKLEEIADRVDEGSKSLKKLVAKNARAKKRKVSA